MTRKRIAIYGGSFNPPHLGHVQNVRALAASGSFDLVVVVPCGPRPDKEIVNDIAPSHRATMADLAFAGIPGVEVDLFDLENDVFTPNIDLQARYADRGIVHHVVGADLICGDAVCDILDRWKDGERLWATGRFVIVKRADARYDLRAAELPPHHETLDASFAGSSSAVRTLILSHEPFEHLVPAKVAAYIKRYGLYRMSLPSESSRLSLETPSLDVYADAWNGRARRMADAFGPAADPDLTVVLGGDGTMLRAIKALWRRRVPFYGVNYGHVGFLLNEPRDRWFDEGSYRDLVVHRVPLLDVEMEKPGGRKERLLAFNDAYVQNVDQAAWVRVVVDGIVRCERMVADTVLVSSPAGSTAYARAMGAAPMLLGHKGLVLAASAVNEPLGWRPVHLPESVITLEALDPVKRPIIGKIDGRAYGPVARMSVRVSRTASAELAFHSDADLEEKRIAAQFPKR